MKMTKDEIREAVMTYQMGVEAVYRMLVIPLLEIVEYGPETYTKKEVLDMLKRIYNELGEVVHNNSYLKGLFDESI